jgi:hypothetical protein
MVTQQQADTILSELRQMADQAQNAWNADASRVSVEPDRRVLVQVWGIPSGSEISAINQNEQEAPGIAAEMRNLGANVIIQSNASGYRVRAVWDSPDGVTDPLAGIASQGP